MLVFLFVLKVLKSVNSIMKERVILCVLVLGNRCMCRGSLVVCIEVSSLHLSSVPRGIYNDGS